MDTQTKAATAEPVLPPTPVRPNTRGFEIFRQGAWFAGFCLMEPSFLQRLGYRLALRFEKNPQETRWQRMEHKLLEALIPKIEGRLEKRIVRRTGRANRRYLRTCRRIYRKSNRALRRETRALKRRLAAIDICEGMIELLRHPSRGRPASTDG